jgi:diguanylate cyclase (GGDEF)-like protein/PAS domain S-box-containing protein
VTPQNTAIREHELALALAHSTDAVVRLGIDGTIACISAGARTLFGIEPDVLAGADLAAFIHPLDRDRVTANWRAVCDSGQRLTCSYRTIHTDGRHIWTESAFDPIVDPHTGIRAELVGVMRDISLRAGALCDLEHGSNAQLLVDSVVDHAIYLLDLDGTVKTWNAGAQRIKGYSAGEIIGSNFGVFYTDEDVRAGEPARSLEIARTIGHFEGKGWRVRKDGSRLWADVAIDAVRNPAGEVIGFAKITRDVTQSGALRRVNEESASIAQLLVDGVVDYAIYLLDLDGIVKSWNAGAQRIKGYSAHEIIGTNFRVFYTADAVRAGEPVSSLAIARANGRFETEGWRVRKDGSRLWAGVVIDTVRNPAGEVVGFAKITRDLTQSSDLRRLTENLRAEQAQLLDAKKDAEQAQVAAMFAADHDALTGLLNRRGLETWIGARPQLVGTLLCLDIDGFKAVNDRGGHAAGDDALQLVARILRRAVRDGDQCVRMGGDEFLVVLHGGTQAEIALDVAARIAAAVEALQPLGDSDGTRIGVSIGIGRFTGAAAFAGALQEADVQLYERKSERQAQARRTANSRDRSPTPPGT